MVPESLQKGEVFVRNDNEKPVSREDGVTPDHVIQMGEVRELIRVRVRANTFTFLDWKRNRGETGWVCTIYVEDEADAG